MATGDLTDAEWREFQSIPDQGYSHRAWINAKIAHRQADGYDQGYDRAMQDAHYVLNSLGYLERRGDDNGNPYRTNALANTARNDSDEP